MNISGHQEIQQALVNSQLSCYLSKGPNPGDRHIRHVSIGLSHCSPAEVLNALDRAGLLSQEAGQSFGHGQEPELEVISITKDYITFKDLNSR